MHERNMPFHRFREKPIRHADVAMSYKENVSHPTVKCSEMDAPRSIQ